MGGAAEVAMAEVRAVAVALAALGGSGTVDAVAALSGLPRARVLRRLRASGLAAPLRVVRYFSCVSPAVGRRDRLHGRGEPGVWSLTPDGHALAAPQDAAGGANGRPGRGNSGSGAVGDSGARGAA